MNAQGPPVELVRNALAAAGYGEPGLRALIGPRDPALAPAEQEALWRFRARGAAPLAVLARLFLLGRPVSTAAARAAFGRGGVRPWETLGLVRAAGGRVRPRVQLSLHDDLVIASDVDPARGAPPAHHVLGPTTATLVLDRMTMRRPVRRALDLGTGTGYLALRLAAHARHVVATDVTARALRFARLNAALAGRSNVTPAISDRFAAFAGRRSRFDLVIGNLPFVISPERRYVYRDAGAALDSFFSGVVAETGRHLVEGGFAQYLGQWVHIAGEPEDERIAPWLVASGCDAMVLRLEREPVDRYAARWLAGPARLSSDERVRRLAVWMDAYVRAGVTEISTGLWTLRRRTARRHVMFVEDVPADVIPTGDQVRARFAAVDPGSP